MNSEQLTARLLATFVDELDEQVRVLNIDLLALEVTPDDPERLKSLFRVAHTLKGAARAAGVAPIESACHAMEGLLVEAREGRLALGAAEFAHCFAAADALGDAATRLRAGQDLTGAPIATMLVPPPRAAPAKKGRSAPRPALKPGPPVVPGRGSQRDGQIRIDGEKLDGLLAATEQLLIASDQTATRPPELRALHESIGRSVGQWHRTVRQVRLALERAHAPAAVTQAVSGMADGLEELLDGTARSASAAAADARGLGQAALAVAEQARRLRMRPFAEACEALPRMVRDLASGVGKEIQFEVEGGDVEVDRAVLDGLGEALIHLVRNAVDHGIESSSQRRRAGKPARGTVRVTAALVGDRLSVSVADDGAGLDIAALRAELGRRGLPSGGEDRELILALFEGGMSTRAEATTISGRGVGLDAVRAAVAGVRGTVRVDWEEGHGTTFTLECPPSLTTVRALLVAVGTQLFALPTTHIERIVRARAAEIQRAEGRDVIGTTDSPVPLVHLARLLPPLVPRPPVEPRMIVLLRAGGRRLGVVVDELIAERQLILRPLGGEGTVTPGVSGAAILELGRVALVLDPVALVAAGLGLEATPEPPGGEHPAARRGRRRILVVDDSITTRTLEQSILEAAGYEVLTAVDGADAWRALQEQGCDAIVSDIEMPRMDGFALCHAIRASHRFKALPVVLVTALEAPEQRLRGMEAGADAYLGKSSFDQRHLLETLAQLIGEPGP
jgi:two-component system, chemotaxis family, sensor kinase CheA